MEVAFKILLGSGMILLNLGIQIWAAGRVLRFIVHRIEDGRKGLDMGVLRMIMLFLFLGHIVQFSTWAILFMALGEFGDFETALYHSTVNFTSLGYGDIVMSEQWRLLGAFEAANGVLMFGLTTGLVLSALAGVLKRNPEFEQLVEQSDSKRDAS
ncbi:MAG: potassium channel family protein [Planctomycetota bacterium]